MTYGSMLFLYFEIFVVRVSTHILIITVMVDIRIIWNDNYTLTYILIAQPEHDVRTTLYGRLQGAKTLK